jgi:hypothetical protein
VHNGDCLRLRNVRSWFPTITRLGVHNIFRIKTLQCYYVFSDYLRKAFVQIEKWGQSVVKQLDSVESTKWICIEWVSLNECISNAGMTFIPDKSEPDKDREEVMPRPTRGWTV